MSACTKCRAGTYSNKAGQTTEAECADCDENYWSSEGKDKCTVCPDHTTASADHSTCVPDAGYYVEEDADPTQQLSILQCPKGSYCPGTGRRVPCPAGTYNGNYGKKTEGDC